MTSCKLEVVETASKLLNAVLSDTPADGDVGCLLYIFEATLPSADYCAHYAVCHIDTV